MVAESSIEELVQIRVSQLRDLKMAEAVRLQSPEAHKRLLEKAARNWVRGALRLAKSSEGNPHGEDLEAIANDILHGLPGDERRLKRWSE